MRQGPGGYPLGDRRGSLVGICDNFVEGLHRDSPLVSAKELTLRFQRSAFDCPRTLASFV